MKTKLLTMFILLSLSTFAQEKMFVHVAKLENISVDGTILDNPLLNNNPNAKIIVSHCWDCNQNQGLDNDKATGLYYDNTNQRWIIYNEDVTDMLVNSSYFVYVADDAYSQKVHLVNTDLYLTVDHPLFNQHPEKAVVLSHIFNSRNNGVNGFWYNEASGNWVIYDESGSSIPSNSDLFVAVEGEPGITGYRHTVTANSITGECSEIDHPLLNGNENAKFVFTHNWGKFGDPANITVSSNLTAYYYNAQAKWSICLEDLSNMPVNATFDLLIQNGDMAVNDLHAYDKTTAFPNPVFNAVNFQSKNMIQQISIYDLAGKELIKMEVNGKSKELNLNSFPKGVYIARIKTDHGEETLKLVKN